MEGEKIEPTMSLVDSSIETGAANDVNYQIKGEFIANGFKQNTLKHEKGTKFVQHSSYLLARSGRRNRIHLCRYQRLCNQRHHLPVRQGWQAYQIVRFGWYQSECHGICGLNRKRNLQPATFIKKRK